MLWQPLHHISGLRLVFPNAQKIIYIPTVEMLKKPLLWLQAIHNYKVTICVTSNFFLSELLKHLQEKEVEWNFNSIKALVISGETININTVRKFFYALQRYGLKINMLYPSYGMSEIGVISGLVPFCEEDINNYATGVKAGKQVPGVSIRIVNNNNKKVAENVEGKIQVKSKACCIGYYEEANSNSLLYHDGWLQTGDLGFIREGILYITGREKDTIIINAKNYHCQDIELEVEKAVKIFCAIACPLRTENCDTDQLVIFFCPILQKDTDTIAYEIHRHLQQHFGLTPKYVIPIHPQQIPRTATGKLQRSHLKDLFLQNISDKEKQSYHKKQLQPKKSEQPRNFQESIICAAFKKVLQVENIGIYDNFFDLGGHSLLIPRLFDYIKNQMGITIPLATIFESPTVEKLSISFERQHSEHIVTIHATGNKAPLVFLHSIEGNGLNYYCLAQQLTDIDRPIYIVNAPQKDGKYMEYHSLENQVTHYIQLLQKKNAAKSYLLAGHSSGGVLAYEMARQLNKMGIKIPFLGLFDTVLLYKKYYWYNWKNYWHFIYNLPGWLCKNQNYNVRIANFFGANLPKEKTWFDILPQETKEYVNANGKRVGQYFSKKNLYPGKITLFRIHRQNNHPKKRIAKDYGWSNYAQTIVDVRYVTGGHKEIMYKENVSDLANKIRETIKFF